jgi:hypothetical protein
MYRLLIIQSFLALISACVGYLLGGMSGARGALAGGLVALVTGGILVWHERRARLACSADPGKNVGILYRCAIERFIVAAGLLAVTVVKLKLPPVYVFAAFLLGQIAPMAWNINQRKQSWHLKR